VRRGHACRPARGLYGPAGAAVSCRQCPAVWVARRGPTGPGWRRPHWIAFGWFAAGTAGAGALDQVGAPLWAYVAQLLAAWVGIGAVADWINRPARHVLTTRWVRRRWYHRRHG
jgi:hypothetical protein